ncbi:hypothetical protein CDT92_21895, partial [Cronobacter sakazakii]
WGGEAEAGGAGVYQPQEKGEDREVGGGEKAKPAHRRQPEGGKKRGGRKGAARPQQTNPARRKTLGGGREKGHRHSQTQ